MDTAKGSRGFVTIATGKEEYYRLAHNLLLSYKYHTENPLPFALLCDRENEYTCVSYLQSRTSVVGNKGTRFRQHNKNYIRFFFCKRETPE